MTRTSLLKREAIEYMTSKNITPMERQEILDWITKGHSVYDNPWLMADEQGRLMDYISALRTANDLQMQNLDLLSATMEQRNTHLSDQHYNNLLDF